MDCIVYPDGEITVLNICRSKNPDTGELKISITPLCDTTIWSLLKYEKDIWVEVDEWSTLYNEGGYYISGDGTMGNEGFIAKTDSNNSLLWAIFLTVTNPIKNLNIVDDWLIGKNEHENGIIKINLKELTDIKYEILE